MEENYLNFFVGINQKFEIKSYRFRRPINSIDKCEAIMKTNAIVGVSVKMPQNIPKNTKIDRESG